MNYHARREHSPGKARDSSSARIYACDELNIEGERRQVRTDASLFMLAHGICLNTTEPQIIVITCMFHEQ